MELGDAGFRQQAEAWLSFPLGLSSLYNDHVTDTLLQTKLHIPRLRPSLVPRPRLVQQLKTGPAGKLILISAPAGSGKTTLIASSVADGGFPVAWLSLDKDDNRAGRFLAYLIAACRKAAPRVGDEAAQLLTAAPQTPAGLILTSLINDLDASDQTMVLVLDDYHVISSQAVHEALTFLLDHSPAALHLVIASRSDPPLPLARLRARGQMVELRAADLRFTGAEAAQFLNDVMGLHLDAKAITALTKRTEGWIAGLQMAALSMRDREDVSGLIQGFSGTNRYILDYLLEEVLTREPEAVQTFLLQTAVLTQLTGPLCDAVTGTANSQEMLEQLERRNLFVVPLDDDRRWYRYHHLFADLLQARLQQTEPDQPARLLARAATWCEANGRLAEAITYALSAHDFAGAATLIERIWGETISRGEVETVDSWLQALPADVVRNSARLGVARCWVLWFQGRISQIEAPVVAAEQAVDALSEPVDAELPAQLAALRAFVARYDQALETAVSHAERARRLLPETLPPRTGAQLRSLVFLALASAYDGGGELAKAADAYAETIRLSRLGNSAAGVTGITYRLAGVLRLLGRLRDAEAACREALAFVEAQGMARLPATGILHLALSEVLVEQNELAAAEQRLLQATQLSHTAALGQWSGRLTAIRNAAPALARLRLAKGDVAGGLTAVQEARASLPEPPSPLAAAELLALEANILIRQGDLNEAARCVAEAEQLAGWDRGLTGELVTLAAARLQVARRAPDASIHELTHFLDATTASGRLGAAMELYLLRSLAFDQQGDQRAAEADLVHALALAEPEGYVRIFVEEGQPVQRLLTQWLSHADAPDLQKYAVHLLSQFAAEQRMRAAGPEDPASVGDPSASLVEPLSLRELEVLQIMALGKTNKEIAQQLVIAPGTVKAHSASIYRKLDVANRTEAVGRARELGILS